MAIPNQQGGNHAWERERGTGYTQENNISQRLQHIHPHHNSFLHSPSLSNPPVRQYFKVTDKNRREWLWAHWTESCRPCPRTSTPSPPHPIPTRDLLRGSHTLPVCHLAEPGCRTVWDRPIDFVVSWFLKADAPSLLQQFVCLQSAPFLSSSLCVHHVLSLTVLTAKSLDCT